MALESTHAEVNEFEREKAAFQVQSELLKNLVATAHSACQTSSAARGEMLKPTLKKTLDLTAKLTGAEKGSLFLLDSNGVVTDSILTRSGATSEERSHLIGTVLDKGLAGWVSRHSQVGLITDTSNDSRWLELTNQPYTVRSALAVPILKGEELLGILTLLHSQPERFSSKHAEQMQMVSEKIVLALENARLYAKLDESCQSLDEAKQTAEAYANALNTELDKGRQIQRGFLPSEIVQPLNFEIAAFFQPALQVSGDFYDIFPLPHGNVGLVLGDVCDKGVGAALFMALFRSLIRIFSGQTGLCETSDRTNEENVESAIESQTPSVDQIAALKAVALTNSYIAQNHGQMSMFATLFFGVLNPANGILTYINGGHEPLLIAGKAGFKDSLKPTGPAVGLLHDAEFDIQQVQLEPGDILIGYTDGVTEARSPNGELFNKERLQLLAEQPASSPIQMLESIKTNLLTHIDNAPQDDDVTVLAVQRAPLAAE